MNILWIRVQHLPGKSQKIRNTQRQELNLLVGENIVRLSNLEGIDKGLYKSLVLPKLLELIKNSKDILSEQYLIDCIIQAFPDDYHLSALEDLLTVCYELNNIDFNVIFSSLIQRLSNYAAGNREELAKTDVFEVMHEFLDKIFEEQVNITPLKQLIELSIPLIQLSIRSYKDKTQYVNTVIGSIVRLIELQGNKDLKEDALLQLLELLLEDLSSFIIDMPQVALLLNYLDPKLRKSVEKEILFGVIKNQKRLNDMKAVDKVLNFAIPFIEGTKKNEDAYEFEENQAIVARIVHLLNTSDPHEEFAIILRLKDAFINGGMTRMKITFPALVWGLYRLGSKVIEEESFILSIFDLAYVLIETIASANIEGAINLFLNGVIALSTIELETKYVEELKFKYINKAFGLYKEATVEDNKKFELLTLVIGTLNKVNIKDDSLLKEVMQHCLKLLRKEEQCKAILIFSHTSNSKEITLHYNEHIQTCLKKAHTICTTCKVNKHKGLDIFISLLNKYLYYYKEGVVILLSNVGA